MKIRTKIDVTYNPDVTGSTTGKVEGVITNTAWLNDFNELGVNYYYGAEGVPFYNNGFTISNGDIDTMYEAVKESIPKNLGYRETTMFTYYFGFIFEMAQKFGIETSEIEIVT